MANVKVEHINPFISATIESFKTMVATELTPGKVKLKDNKDLTHDISGIIGLSGGQGSGKSTISNILKIILKENYNLETVIFSIDDFYKTLKQRKAMSKNISPLFLTRGAPGTHDTKMILNCIKKLQNIKFKKMMIPKFNKATDDRVSKKNG